MATPEGQIGSFVSEMPVQKPRQQTAEDGTVITREGEDLVVDLEPQAKETRPEMGPEWHTNLADQLTSSERAKIAQELFQMITVDKQVREMHFERLRNGVELMGLRSGAESDAPFDGAANVTDPLIAEAVVNFQSRAIEELFPAEGPVKGKVLGERTDEKVAQAERVEEFMNYQLTEEDEGYFEDVDQMLFYLPLSGSAFKKIYPDEITSATTGRYVTAEDFIVPYYAKSLRDASRYTHEFRMNGNDITRAQQDGYFLQTAQLQDPSMIRTDVSTTFQREDIQDLADDRTQVAHEDDKEYTLHEVHIDYAMPFDDPEVGEDTDISPPYIITIDSESMEVLAVRRNWRKGDETYQKRIWFVHYKFLPGLGFYGFGYMHIIGALAQATSGSLRAILDAAALHNMPCGFKAKQANVAGEMRFSVGEFKDVDLPPEDLQNGFLPLPVNPPSPAMTGLYEQLLKRGKEFSGTVEVMTGGADNRGPVGTTLALIEQGSKPQSAIHKRLHRSMRTELKRMAELNYELMEHERYPYTIGDEEKYVLRSDFDQRVDVAPVSDPNIFSNVQRIAMNQAVLELVTQFPDVFQGDARKVAVKRMLNSLKVPDVDELIPEDEQKNLDPVTENQYLLTGRPVQVFPTQDDEAHMAVHQHFMQTNLAGMGKEVAEASMPAFIAHVVDHQAQKYRKDVEAMLGMELPPMSLYDEDETESLPEDIEVMISRAVAARLRQEQAAKRGEPQTPEEAEARAVEDAADAKTIQELERAKAKHEEDMRQKREKHDEEMRQKQVEFEAEQKRKAEEHTADMKRQAEKARYVTPPRSRSNRDAETRPTKKSDGQSSSQPSGG